MKNTGKIIRVDYGAIELRRVIAGENGELYSVSKALFDIQVNPLGWVEEMKLKGIIEPIKPFAT